jgi:hypothetical protein
LSNHDDQRREYSRPAIEPGGRPGRPPKYTRRRHERICELVAEGNSREASAALAGIAPATLTEWLREYPGFSADIKKADGIAERDSVQTIRRASRRSWYAAAWWLERRHPTRWGKDRAPDLEAEEQEPLRLGVDGGSDDDLHAIDIAPDTPIDRVRELLGLEHVADPEP